MASLSSSSASHHLLLLITLILLTFRFPSSSSLPVNVWPKPTYLFWSSPHTITTLSHTFQITFPSSNNTYLSASVSRYHRLLLTESHAPILDPTLSDDSSSSSPLQTLYISVTDLDSPLVHGVDESYSLSIPSSAVAANLTAATVWGAMRGLETFSQLVWGQQRRLPLGVEIKDAPLFGYRGLLLDTARNFYPVEDILRTIEGLSYNKMNVFHWHITDSHSFPLELPSEPQLAEKGSYGHGMRYSVGDVARIVQFGLEHGVRVIPEIDAPAHTGSWAAAYPELVTCANMFWWPAGSSWDDRLASEPGTGQLNPLNPKTYQLLNNIINDIVSLFPDPFLHAGADEVVPGCWKTDPSIQSYLSQNTNNTLSQILETFVQKTLPNIVSHNRTAIYYEDVLLNPTIKVNPSLLPPSHTILQTWNNGPNNTKLLVEAGYRVIVSSWEFYYLDCGHGDFVGNDSRYNQPSTSTDVDSNGGSWCGPFKTWQKVYNYDITDGLNEEEKKLVLGGEVALWSEQMDGKVVDGKLWPRTSAMAEAMWSGNRDDKGRKRYGEATNRLNEWRYRMVGRGIMAEPIQPLWCVKNPGMCNTVHSSTDT
ncbi:Beta-hexosaminidase 2 [Linum perenne]